MTNVIDLRERLRRLDRVQSGRDRVDEEEQCTLAQLILRKFLAGDFVATAIDFECSDRGAVDVVVLRLKGR